MSQTTSSAENPDQPAVTGVAGPDLAVLKGIVIGLGALLIFGTLGMIVALAMKQPPAVPLSEMPPVALLEGEAVTSASLNGGRALLVVTSPQGQRIVLLDLASGETETLEITNGTPIPTP